MEEIIKSLENRFEFRYIRPEVPAEMEEAAEVERICFPPNEACSREHMIDRVLAAPDLFLVAIEKETGKMAGFVNGIATDEEKLRDDFFRDASLHNPAGANIMILGVDVLPEYRLQGLARKMVALYAEAERAKCRQRLVLTCLEEKVPMYAKFGFRDLGMSQSTWGGEAWHEMDLVLGEKENRGEMSGLGLGAIHHIAIICSDKEEALAFYRDKLGFPVIRENYRPERDDWKIDLRLNASTELELFIMKDHPQRPSPEAYGLRHLAFRVESVEEMVEKLAAMGIESEPVRRDTFTGERMTFFHDPDGLPIEIHE